MQPPCPPRLPAWAIDKFLLFVCLRRQYHQIRVLLVSPEARSARMAAASGTLVVNRALCTLLYTCITDGSPFRTELLTP
jgi:hypothetical protein